MDDILLTSMIEPGMMVTLSMMMELLILTFSMITLPDPRLTPVSVVLSAMLAPDDTEQLTNQSTVLASFNQLGVSIYLDN